MNKTMRTIKAAIYALSLVAVASSLSAMEDYNGERLSKAIEANNLNSINEILFESIEENNITIVGKILASGKIDINKAVNKVGMPPLHVATENGSLAVAELLINKGGVDVNKQGLHGYRALDLAAKSGRINFVQLFMDKTEPYHYSALRSAVCGGHADVVRLLLDKGNVLDMVGDFDAEQLLCDAARSGHVEVVKLLLDKAEDMYDKLYGETSGKDCYEAYDETELLHGVLASGCSLEIVKLFLDRKKVDIRWKAGKHNAPLLHYAVSGGNLVVVRFFLGIGLDINARDNNGQTALHWAVNKDDVEIVRLLLSRKARIIKDLTGETPRDLAISPLVSAKIANLLGVRQY